VNLMSKLDKEEQEILNSFEAGNLKQSKNSKAQLEQHKQRSKKTLE
jgi:hypothetical protein